MAWFSPRAKKQGYTSRMAVAANAIERADAWWPHSPNGCLRQSLLFWWLFRWLGFDSEIRTGIRRGSDGFDLHAWVQSNGVVLNDSPVNVSQYTILWDALSTRVIESKGKS